MSEKSELKLTDDLIREALYLELDNIDIPPPDKIWQRIESGLEQPRSPARRPAFNWVRPAAVAAACLVIVFGTIQVSRIIQFSDPAADFSELPVSTGEEVAMLEIDHVSEDESEITAILEKEYAGVAEVDMGPEDDNARAAQDVPPVTTGLDSSLDDWPLAIAEDIMLDKTIILVDNDGPEYRGALYSSSHAELLWVKSMTGENLEIFIDYLGLYIGVDLQDMGETNGFTRLGMAELPGLAWQKDGQNQALLVISGLLTEDDLKRIAYGGD